MKDILVNAERCKGCGFCVTACPQKIVALDEERINAKGYHPAHVTDKSKCTSCGLCAIMCPDVAIKIIDGK